MAIESDRLNGTIATREDIGATVTTQQLTATLSAGTPGPPGPQGPAGPQGPTGPAGPTGPQGEQGQGLELQGSVPSSGDLPLTGSPGEAWITSDTGHMWVWDEDTSDWIDAGQVQGPPGPAGPQGPQGVQGAAGTQGAQGPAGATGPVGPAGPPGPTGDTGAQGPQGAQGIQGIQGPIGPAGPQGTVGPAGPTGATGPQGEQGEPGPQGPQGATGPAGPQGETGATGATGPQGPIGPQGPAGVISGVQDEGTALTARTNLNFVGAGVIATDDAANNRTLITIAGGAIPEFPFLVNGTVIVNVSGEGITPIETSYANPGGTGDRRNRIAYTFSPGLFSNPGPWKMLDGITSDIGYFATVAASGAYIRFDFGYRHVIDEFRWKQDSVSALGTWKMQASNDGSNWQDVGSSFTLGTATVQTVTLGGTTPYRYWRLTGVSGSTNGGPNFQEIEFKISPATDSPAATVWETGDRSSSITMTPTGIAVQSGPISKWVDGNTSSYWWTNTGAVSGSTYIVFDFGSARILDAMQWLSAESPNWGSWQWQGSANGTDWTNIGSSHPVPEAGMAYSSSGLWWWLDLALAPNRTAYRYYRMLGVSGSMTGQNLHEIRFRIL